MSGPAAVATADALGRRTEYWESLRTRGASAFRYRRLRRGAMLVVQTSPGLAALGAISTATIGLTASWYYVGTGQPYRLLFLETVPRVLGTAWASS